MSTEIRIDGVAAAELTSDAAQFYEAYWKDGAAVAAGTISRQTELLSALFPRRPTGQRILELGVGAEGGLIAHLKNANDVFGLDASPVAVAAGERFGLRVRPFNADRDTIPFPDDHFDIVFAFEVCEHLANPQFALEQIRRVLKPGALFVASTPNPLTHHWPRFFYPSLIEHDAFREFLLANKLSVDAEIGLNANAYAEIIDTPSERVWSWVWVCRNAKGDASLLERCGREFWSRVDARGIRTRTMEAADLFRAAQALNPASLALRGQLAAALVYRVVNGEEREFRPLVLSLAEDCGGAAALDAKYWLCMIQIEMSKFGWPLLPETQMARFIGDIHHGDPARAAELRQLSNAALAFAVKTGRLG